MSDVDNITFGPEVATVKGDYGKRNVYYTLPWLMRGWLMSLIEGYDLRLGAELGVWRGDTTFFLLDNAPFLVLHGVDLFERQLDHPYYCKDEYDFTEVYPELVAKSQGYDGRLILHRGFTHEVADSFPDGYFDFVFIDADHEYEGVKRDILAWYPKVRKGGFLMGHDTHADGVRRAVMECLTNYEVSYDTFCWVEQIREITF
jgi:hypothetical protein